MVAVLKASGVAIAFGGFRAVDGVDLELHPGESLALVGPNGAGKTSLLNLLSGQLALSEGSISLLGRDVSRRSPDHPDRQPLLRSFQNGGVFGRLTAVQNVALPAIVRGRPRARAEEDARRALARVGLEPVADWRADTLSGGQRKLIDFARMLAVEPMVALLDEPTAGVNPAIMNQMRDIIVAQQRAGLATIIVSHDLTWVFDLCARVVVLANGRPLAEGTPAEVSANPEVQSAYLT